MSEYSNAEFLSLRKNYIFIFLCILPLMYSYERARVLSHERVKRLRYVCNVREERRSVFSRNQNCKNIFVLRRYAIFAWRLLQVKSLRNHKSAFCGNVRVRKMRKLKIFSWNKDEVGSGIRELLTHSYSLRIINIKRLRKETKINCNVTPFAQRWLTIADNIFASYLFLIRFFAHRQYNYIY